MLLKILKFFGKKTLMFFDKKKNLNSLTKYKKSKNLKFEIVGFT